MINIKKLNFLLFTCFYILNLIKTTTTERRTRTIQMAKEKKVDTKRDKLLKIMAKAARNAKKRDGPPRRGGGGGGGCGGTIVNTARDADHYSRSK